jgi:hypothetical protein
LTIRTRDPSATRTKVLVAHGRRHFLIACIALAGYAG